MSEQDAAANAFEPNAEQISEAEALISEFGGPYWQDQLNLRGVARLVAHLRTTPEGMSLVPTDELATLRDQLATVTLERDALRADSARLTWLATRAAWFQSEADWRLNLPEEDDSKAWRDNLCAAIDAALQEKP